MFKKKKNPSSWHFHNFSLGSEQKGNYESGHPKYRPNYMKVQKVGEQWQQWVSAPGAYLSQCVNIAPFCFFALFLTMVMSRLSPGHGDQSFIQIWLVLYGVCTVSATVVHGNILPDVTPDKLGYWQNGSVLYGCCLLWRNCVCSLYAFLRGVKIFSVVQSDFVPCTEGQWAV